MLSFLFSCREDFLPYSCDPVLNQIITQHLTEYAQYSVKEVTIYDLGVQRAIFRSYEPSKKREVWIEKFNYLLTNGMYTGEEFQHLKILRDHISPNYFNPDSVTVNAPQRKLFLADWKIYAKNQLRWTDKYIAFLINRLYTDPAQFDAEISMLKKISAQAVAESESSCDCNRAIDYCNGYCGSATCETLPSGCGDFWQYACDGACE